MRGSRSREDAEIAPVWGIWESLEEEVAFGLSLDRQGHYGHSRRRDRRNKGVEKGIDPTGVGSNKGRNNAGPDPEGPP